MIEKMKMSMSIAQLFIGASQEAHAVGTNTAQTFCSLGQSSLFPLAPPELQLPASSKDVTPLHLAGAPAQDRLTTAPSTAAAFFFMVFQHQQHLGQEEQKYWVKAKREK